MYKPKILVVEDDPAISNLIRTTLDTQGYQYHMAQTGSGALMEVLSYKADVVILDLGLPDMDLSLIHISEKLSLPVWMVRTLMDMRWTSTKRWSA